MLCGATQDGRVMVERSDRVWSTGEGNGEPLQYSCLESPMNSMRRQNDRIKSSLHPYLIGLGMTTGIGMGLGGIGSSTTFYHTLSKELTDDVERIVKSLVAIQDQLDSLAEVVLQNRRGLDLLPAEKGGLCLFLNEECCIYVNQSEKVRDMAQQLRE